MMQMDLLIEMSINLLQVMPLYLEVVLFLGVARNSSVSLSTIELEYVACTAAVQEAI